MDLRAQEEDPFPFATTAKRPTAQRNFFLFSSFLKRQTVLTPADTVNS
jgi:hypothetical protein